MSKYILALTVLLFLISQSLEWAEIAASAAFCTGMLWSFVIYGMTYEFGNSRRIELEFKDIKASSFHSKLWKFREIIALKDAKEDINAFYITLSFPNEKRYFYYDRRTRLITVDEGNPYLKDGAFKSEITDYFSYVESKLEFYEEYMNIMRYYYDQSGLINRGNYVIMKLFTWSCLALALIKIDELNGWSTMGYVTVLVIYGLLEII